jgi:tetratricopeptide (TPR) repeat protein
MPRSCDLPGPPAGLLASKRLLPTAIAATALLTGLLAVGCTRDRGTVSEPDVPGLSTGGRPVVIPSGSNVGAGRAAQRESTPIRPLRRCFPDLAAWEDPQMADLLDRAAAYQEEDDFLGVLVCAEEAARQEPRSVEAHHDRALALMRLGRFEEARDALALALAIAPKDSECLEQAAELYINRLPPSAERTAVGLEYARRGRRAAGRNKRQVARMALLEGQALVDLGRSAEALEPLAVARNHNPQDLSAWYEQGVAYFELCRFGAARRAFEEVLVRDAGHAHALYHLALINEREDREEDADRLFAEASRRDPKSFPPVPQVSQAEFRMRVEAAVERLPAAAREDLRAVPVETADLPAPEDLTAERPPLSPTILGLFRGLSLGREPMGEETRPAAARAGVRGRQARVTGGSPPDRDAPRHALVATGEGAATTGSVPARAIVLYRRNILRSIHGAEELDRAIERTLLHEVGHLRGEDDGSLRDRGLE